MKTSRCTGSRMLALFREAEVGTPVPGPCCTHGISSATCYKWRFTFDGMDVPMVARMKELVEENRRLKKMNAEA